MQAVDEVSSNHAHVALPRTWSAELSSLLPVILAYVGSAADVYRSSVYVCKDWHAAAESSAFWTNAAVSLAMCNEIVPFVAAAAPSKRFVIDHLFEQLKATQWDIDPNLLEEHRVNDEDAWAEGPCAHNLSGTHAPPSIQHCYASTHYWCSLAQTFARPPPSLPFVQLQLCTAARFDQAVRWTLVLRSLPSEEVLFQELFRQAAGIHWRQTMRSVSLAAMPTDDTHLQLEWRGRDTSKIPRVSCTECHL
ncbi:hypothetical protein SPRG_05250 [Saprolegnia parasitica CBS 223.65]|uniref:F-box domain-containing protein n=1 Tax=Saprolegnia parasitica (strain CBS 223.65) TaxID=695850 RepID=A0A067CH38_SAPPC|nr:hypothetical protein SPRG_05250 [Saprolegnia parasitica CBS 223.65]KDO30059.1 hypothetical protein SPRG_05250 [Saprolegnia parasitica CBS 223.65]|eukprot:XP_012199240.1 hypothetical protein SPRG_05250 [Saprolegnia parasitica CBS 223.65]